MGNWADSPLFDAGDRLVLELVENLTLQNRVDDDLYARLEDCFEPTALVRLTMTVALAGMVNRVHATFRTTVDVSPGA